MICPRCGNDANALLCDHCHSRLPNDQAADLEAVWRAIGRMGGNRSETPYNDDFYTHPSALQCLIPYLPKSKVYWEVAWGRGDLAAELKKIGKVVGSAKWDFITVEPPKFDIIVSNPPYSLRDQFLARAYALGKPFAFLLPVESLVGAARRTLFTEFGVQLLVPSRRIHFISTDGAEFQPTFATAWFCWRLLPADLLFA
jgi:hypothetical protein